jgi:NADPH:quinone reductase
MKAVVLNSFGGPEELILQDIPAPEIEANELLIKVEYAGVGQWDIFEREGGYARMFGMDMSFPYVLGSEGAGIVAAVGDKVKNFEIGDRVFAAGFLNPKGGFYAEYAAVEDKFVAHIPETITVQEAAVISGVGLTALRGLEDVLILKPGETIMIVGASGGVGHMAVQIAKNIGARVFAVASGEDGVKMVKGLGIETVIDGRKEDIVSAARTFAKDGFDTALLTTGGVPAEMAVECIRKGGRIAYPNGIDPLPQVPVDMKCLGYNGEPDSDILHRLSSLISSGNLNVFIDKTYLLTNTYNAHRALDKHYLGKVCLEVNI